MRLRILLVSVLLGLLRRGPGLSTTCASPWRKTIFRPRRRPSIRIAAKGVTRISGGLFVARAGCAGAAPIRSGGGLCEADEGSGDGAAEKTFTRCRAALAYRAGGGTRSPVAGSGGARSTNPGHRFIAVRVADLRKHFHSRPPAEEPELAFVAGKAGARTQGR